MGVRVSGCVIVLRARVRAFSSQMCVHVHTCGYIGMHICMSGKFQNSRAGSVYGALRCQNTAGQKLIFEFGAGCI